MKRLGKTSSATFQQDEASAYFSRDVHQYFDKVFPNQWIGKGGVHQMGTTCSPDLSPLNFILSGYVKNNIYKSSIRNLDELKIKIIGNISVLFFNVVKMMHLCISVEGEDFEQLL